MLRFEIDQDSPQDTLDNCAYTTAMLSDMLSMSEGDVHLLSEDGVHGMRNTLDSITHALQSVSRLMQARENAAMPAGMRAPIVPPADQPVRTTAEKGWRAVQEIAADFILSKEDETGAAPSLTEPLHVAEQTTGGGFVLFTEEEKARLMAMMDGADDSYRQNKAKEEANIRAMIKKEVSAQIRQQTSKEARGRTRRAA